MNIYLDESYNLQSSKNKIFISINGFSILEDKRLRKRWRIVRKPYSAKGRIHATDTKFEKLRISGIKLLGRNDVTILSIFQLVQEIPHLYFSQQKVNFDSVYTALLEHLFLRLSLQEYKKVRIIIDARKHKGGILGEKRFRENIMQFLADHFPNTDIHFHQPASYQDILLELADFISNTFYREYQKDKTHIFNQLGFKMMQIKNPLKRADILQAPFGNVVASKGCS